MATTMYHDHKYPIVDIYSTPDDITVTFFDKGHSKAICPMDYVKEVVQYICEQFDVELKRNIEEFDMTEYTWDMGRKYNVHFEIRPTVKNEKEK